MPGKADAAGPARSMWRLFRCEEGEPDQGLERGAHKELTPQWREQDSMSTVDMPPSRVGDRNQGMEVSEQEMSSDCVQHLRHRTTKTGSSSRRRGVCP